MASGTEPQAPIRNIFPFHHKPNTLDRDRIVIPAGWDSWGKILVLRDGFEAKMWGDAWERDLAGDAQAEGVGARKLYASLVPDQGMKVSKGPISSRIIANLLQAATSTAVQQSNTGTSVPRQKLRRKCKETRPRSSRSIQEPSRSYKSSSWACWAAWE